MSIIKGTNQIVAGFGGTKRSIGEVYFSQSSLATDNSGALPLFTGETIASANTIYPDFYNWVSAHTELQCTSAEYESALSTYGECPKYVVSSGSLRLPKYKNKGRYLVKSETNGSSWYNLYSDGWLEQGGYFGNPSTVGTTAITETFWKSYITPPTVLFGNMSHRKQTAYDSEHYPYDVTANGFTHENVQPQGQGTRWYAFGYAANTPMENIMYPWIVSFTAAIPASTAQAAEFQQGLSGKADTNLGNIPSNYDYVVESRVYADGSWYRKYKSGWLEQGGIISPSYAWSTINLLKPYANTQYIVLAAVINGNTGAGVTIKDKTISSFTIYQNVPQNWEAKGMGVK